MKLKKLLNSPWMILVISCSLGIFAYIANINVSEASPDIPNLRSSGILYIWVTGLHYALVSTMTVVYFFIFWGIIYGVYFLLIIIEKYRNG